MSAGFGTLGILDTLAVQRNTTVAKIGEDKVFEAVDLALKAHDAIMNEMVSEIAEFTSDQLRFSGAVQSFNAEELDEYGRPSPQKLTAGSDLGFPLRRYGNALQWTRDWFAMKTPAELAGQVAAIMDADKRNILKAIKNAVHTPTNSTFKDRFVNNISIPVKALANADGFPIPPDLDGNAFDASTHTHYLVCATPGTLIEADVVSLIATVREHFGVGSVVVDINQAEENTIRGFTDFKAYVDARIIPSVNVDRGAAALDVTNTYDRAIGILNGAEVRVKPWAVAGYLFCHVLNNGPVVAVRTRDGANIGALELIGDYDEYPLRAQMWRREFGVGVSNRVAGAVLDITNASFTAPTL